MSRLSDTSPEAEAVLALAKQWGRLDIPYLNHWAAELGVLDLLEKARSEVAS